MTRGARECGRVQEKVQAGVLASQHHETRRGETRRDETRRGEARRDEARRGEARHGITASRHQRRRDSEWRDGEIERWSDGEREGRASTAERGIVGIDGIAWSLRACQPRVAHTCSNVARDSQWRSDSVVSTGEQQRAAHATATRAARVEAGPVPPGRENGALATSHTRAMRAVPLFEAREEVVCCH